MRRLVSLACAALVAGAAAPAAADPRPRLAVTRGAGAELCPDAAGLAEAVAMKMKHAALDPADGDAPPLFDVRIDKGPRGFEATVQANGSLRVLEDSGPTCGALAGAIAITLAILLDDAATRPGLSPPPPPLPPSPTPAAPAGLVPPPFAFPAQIADRRPAPPSPEGVRVPVARDAAAPVPGRLALSLRGVVSDGLQLPGAFGLDVRAGVRVADRVRVEAGVLYLPSRSASFDDGTDVIGTAVIGLLAGMASGCVRALGPATSVRADVCADLGVGALMGRGEGFAATNRSSTLAWGAAGASLGLQGPLVAYVDWFARGGALVPFQRRTFEVENAGTAFRAAPIGGHLGLGLAVTIF